jgi:hypothetical protein
VIGKVCRIARAMPRVRCHRAGRVGGSFAAQFGVDLLAQDLLQVRAVREGLTAVGREMQPVTSIAIITELFLP